MQFKVPQFIDIEDKLFGPFTFRQFVYMVGGGGMIFVIYRTLPLWIGIFIILPVAGLTLLLTFYKINTKPFIYYLQAAINYLVSSKLYIWKQRLVKPGSEQEESANALQPTSVVPILSSNSLKDLSWSLDIQEKDTNS
ncbi:MAG: PrgI family protein [Patescibacteria group bacterium]